MRKLVVAGALCCAAALMSCGMPVNKEVAAACDNGEVDADKVLMVWQRAGVIRSMRPGGGNTWFLEVNTALWAEGGRKVQLSIGIAAYCKIKTRDGIGTVLIQGSLKEDLGSQVNGHWMD